MKNDKKAKPKKVFLRPDLKEGMTPEEEAEAINRMSEAMLDAILGKKSGKGPNKGAREGKDNG